VLGELLGLSPGELAALHQAGVIEPVTGAAPTPSRGTGGGSP
jgi:hypothetical protein